MHRRIPCRPLAAGFTALLAAVAAIATAAERSYAQIVARPLRLHDAPVVLELPASTRAVGLGNAFVAVADDPDAIFYNPALLSSAEGIGVSAQRYGEASTLGSFSAAIRLGPGTLGAGARFLDQPAILTAAGPFDHVSPLADSAVFRGSTVHGSSLAATLGYGLSFDDPSPTWLDDVRVGVAASVLEQTVAGLRGAGFAFDVGAAVELEWLMAGVALQNIGPDLEIGGEEHRVPARAVLGVAHESQRLGPLDVITAATLIAPHVDTRSLAPGIGVELSYWPISGRTFFARVGARHDPHGLLSPLTFGGGFEADAFAIDYAYERAGDAGGAHHVGLRWWR